MNDQEFIQFLIQNGKAWVQEQQSRHRRHARMLTAQEKGALVGFFEDSTLDTARVKCVPIIENPGFYHDVPIQQRPSLIDFTQMAGITFVDTILISHKHHTQDPPSPSLLFHELVHFVQYGLLGRDAFVEQYVLGWIQSAGTYDCIPLERQAFDLEGRYTNQPHAHFSVEAEVRRLLPVV